jgi:hypothetical protein
MLAAATGAMLLLMGAGCSSQHGGVGDSSPSSELVRHYPGAPPGAKMVPSASGLGILDTAVWAAAGQLAIVAWGSSGCPRLAARLAVVGTNTLLVTMSSAAPPSRVTCTADLAPTTSVLRVPKAIDGAQPVIVQIVDGPYGATVTVTP